MYLLPAALGGLLASISSSGFVVGAAATPTGASRSYVVKERHVVPRGWSAVSRPSLSERVSLQIGLKQQNQNLLDQHAVEVSNPTHPRYGQYLTAEEIQDMIAPSDETVDAVKAWLEEHGISAATLGFTTRDTITVNLPIEKVEQLLNTEYSVFRHEDGSELIRAPEWSLPEYLHDLIDVVQPTNSFFRLKKDDNNFNQETGITWDGGADWYKTSADDYNPGYGQPCDIRKVCNVTGTNLAGAKVNATTLLCLRCLYGTINYKVQVPDKNAVGVTNYLNETQVRSDIKQYLQLYRPEAAAVADKFPITIVANGENDQTLSPDEITAQKNLEGNLDGELVLGISWPTFFKAWNTGGSPPFIPDLNTPTNTNEPYLTWLNYVLAQKNLPQVISTSYGDDEQTIPFAYASKVCDGFKQLAARGISVLFSSGDSGVGANGTCFSNKDPKKAMFLPAFPASCPWVTAVGGTQGYLPEVAVKRFGSGAGFSNYFGRPSYQNSAVQGYLGKIGNLYAGLYNRTGRAYPDVAALGDHDVIVYAGKVTTIGGTSASAPTFAAIVALINDALIASGRPTLGFLNPWLYGGAYRALTDITSGSSIGCNTSGFPATTGWDAVTGFGTPNFNKLVAAAKNQYY